MTIQASAGKPTMAVLSAELLLATMVLITAGGNSPTLIIDFRLVCPVMNWAIGGLFLQ